MNYQPSTVLSPMVVFYQRKHRVKSAKDLSYFRSAERSFDRLTAPSLLSKYGEQCLALANTESQKELMALKELFNIREIKGDPKSFIFWKNVIEAYNKALSSEKIYRRILKKAASDNKADSVRVSISASIGSYIQTAINGGWTAFTTGLFDVLENSVMNGILLENSIATYIDTSVETFLKDAVKMGVTNAFNSRDLVGNKDDNTQSLAELNGLLNTARGNLFLEEIYKVWGVDKLKDEIIRLIKGVNSPQIKAQFLKKSTSTKLSKTKASILSHQYQKGGTAAEKFGAYAADVLLSGVNSSNIHVSEVGVRGVKPDFMITADVDMSSVNKLLEQPLGTREKNIVAFEQFIQNTEKKTGHIKQGFVIYVNAKNYSLTERFKQYGFSSGEPMDIGKISALLGKTSLNLNALLGAIANIIPGAIGEGQKDSLQEVLATQIANFLFDDIQTIGEDAASGPTAIHLLYLNEVYVPLSFLLTILGRALKNAGADIEKTVRVKIDTPNSILYPLPPSAADKAADRKARKEAALTDSKFYPYNTGPERWTTQAQAAAASIKVSAYFLSDFSNLLRSLGQ